MICILSLGSILLASLCTRDYSTSEIFFPKHIGFKYNENKPPFIRFPIDFSGWLSHLKQNFILTIFHIAACLDTWRHFSYWCFIKLNNVQQWNKNGRISPNNMVLQRTFKNSLWFGASQVYLPWVLGLPQWQENTVDLWGQKQLFSHRKSLQYMSIQECVIILKVMEKWKEFSIC